MSKILIVDDDIPFAVTLKEWLQFEHHKVDVAHHADDAQAFMSAYAYDFLLLDWQLPGVTGLEICRKYRQANGQAYVIMLTGMNTVDNKVEGLEAGADDYLPKPFDMKELAARIKALARRSVAYGGELLRAGDLTLDTRSRIVSRSGVELKLKPLEYCVLEFFMKHPSQVVSAEALLKRVWDSNTEASTDSVYTCINRLRKQLNESDKEAVIKTVHKVGYRFDPSAD